jgi:hypothetical protein
MTTRGFMLLIFIYKINLSIWLYFVVSRGLQSG